MSPLAKLGGWWPLTGEGRDQTSAFPSVGERREERGWPQGKARAGGQCGMQGRGGGAGPETESVAARSGRVVELFGRSRQGLPVDWTRVCGKKSEGVLKGMFWPEQHAGWRCPRLHGKDPGRCWRGSQGSGFRQVSSEMPVSPGREVKLGSNP